MKDHNNISDSVKLKERIMELNSQKYEQEEEIKHDFKELRYSLTPGNLIKESISMGRSKAVLDKDNDLTHDFVKQSVNLGLTYAIGKTFGRSASIKGFVASMIAESVTKYIVNNNTDKVIAGIGTLVGKFTKNKKIKAEVEDEADWYNSQSL